MLCYLLHEQDVRGYDGKGKGVASFVRQELGFPSRQAEKRWVN